MFVFDLGLLIALFAVALIFRTKASVFLLSEKVITLTIAFFVIEHSNTREYYGLLSLVSFCFALVLIRFMREYKLLALTAFILAAVHAFVVVSYYFLPNHVYQTAYNINPKLYLIVVALQTLGISNGNNRPSAICCGPALASAVYFIVHFFNRAKYQRVETK